MKESDILALIVYCEVFAVGMLIGSMLASPRVTAMDVYEGKTTLEITYKDGVPIDSVVVFKDK